MLWRQGDIFIEDISSIPAGAVRLAGVVLAEGEITGHHHRIEDDRSAALFFHGGELLLNVVTPRAKLVHEEHATIELERGAYRVWRQREFAPELRATPLVPSRRIKEFDPKRQSRPKSRPVRD